MNEESVYDVREVRFPIFCKPRDYQLSFYKLIDESRAIRVDEMGITLRDYPGLTTNEFAQFHAGQTTEITEETFKKEFNRTLAKLKSL